MSTIQTVREMKTKYKEPHEAFTLSNLESREDPFKQFQAWFEQAKTTKDIIEPRAFCLATTDGNGTPSARMVIMKNYSPEGIQFFTHYTSRKGKDLEENSKAAVLFYWEALRRQIRIEGFVHKLPIEEAEEYFKSRPVPIQIGTAASDQSTIVPDRGCIVEKAKELEKRYEEVGEVERPAMWGGYLFVPNLFEFWQGQSDTVHDRICFQRVTTGWECYRLAP
ncbi:pyridoxine-5'-phosphate oxidase-like isoform X2 [Rhodnius prolixus]|uniref:Pyridoxine-5'-phosphate oxidase n=2 Tax=Rhodnius TaxID=13248 RepID=R4G801_RHOPR